MTDGKQERHYNVRSRLIKTEKHINLKTRLYWLEKSILRLIDLRSPCLVTSPLQYFKVNAYYVSFHVSS